MQNVSTILKNGGWWRLIQCMKQTNELTSFCKLGKTLIRRFSRRQLVFSDANETVLKEVAFIVSRPMAHPSLVSNSFFYKHVNSISLSPNGLSYRTSQ